MGRLQVLPEPIEPDLKNCHCSPHDCHSGAANAEQSRVVMLHTDADLNATRDEPNSAFCQAWKTTRHFAVFREHSVADTLDNANEFMIEMFHQEHVHMAATVNASQLRLAIVCDDPPVP